MLFGFFSLFRGRVMVLVVCCSFFVVEMFAAPEKLPNKQNRILIKMNLLLRWTDSFLIAIQTKILLLKISF